MTISRDEVLLKETSLLDDEGISLIILDKVWLVIMATSDVLTKTELGKIKGVWLIPAELRLTMSVDESTVDVVRVVELYTSDAEGVRPSEESVGVTLSLLIDELLGEEATIALETNGVLLEVASKIGGLTDILLEDTSLLDEIRSTETLEDTTDEIGPIEKLEVSIIAESGSTDTLLGEILLVIIGPIAAVPEGVWLNMLKLKSTEEVSIILLYAEAIEVLLVVTKSIGIDKRTSLWSQPMSLTT